MKVITINDSSRIERETATTIGFFDGVHKGHRFLIEQLKEKARSAGLPTSVVTFFVHPRKVLESNSSVQLLNSFDERIQQLASTGIDYCYVMHFTPELAETSARDFIWNILDKKLKIKLLLIGYDHKFGKERDLNFNHYFEYGKACGIIVDKAAKLQDSVSVSSTQIRRALQEGDVKKTAALLSYNYRLEGIVVQGNHLGRTIGFPTANLKLNNKEKLIPPNGVYAVGAVIDERKYQGMTYIGERPTVSPQGEKRIETYLLAFDEDIYGKQMQIEFIDFIRPDISFGSIEELREQLIKDRLMVNQS